MKTSRDELNTKVDALHVVLNEIYAIDSNWRNAGDWPSDVEGSTLHPGASGDAMAAAELRFGHEFPPSYKEFLSLHCAWEHFWGDFTLIGTGSPATQDAIDEIIENTEDQASDLQRKLGDRYCSAAVGDWEAEEERNLCLSNHLVIGTDFSGAHWIYDVSSRREDGELTLVRWNISFGAQEPRFSTFYEFLDWALSEAEARLEWTKQEIAKAKEERDG